MMSLLMIHTRLYLPRMSLLFLFYQDRILKGLTGVTFCQEGGMSQAISGLAVPLGFPLDHQGYVASKLHPGVAAYSSYIGACIHRDSLSLTRGDTC